MFRRIASRIPDIAPTLMGGTWGGRGSLSAYELALLSAPLPTALKSWEIQATWQGYQKVLDGMLLRMGREIPVLDTLTDFLNMRSRTDLRHRRKILPLIFRAMGHMAENPRQSDRLLRIAGEVALMELEAAALYRTYCIPALVRGLMKTDKFRDYPIQRMMGTYMFLITMFQYPIDDPKVLKGLRIVNRMHHSLGLAGVETETERDLMKYIGLNLFQIGPAMRIDLTPAERQALCGIAVLVMQRMGLTIKASTLELEAFIAQYEAREFFDPNDPNSPRPEAIAIAQATQAALKDLPVLSWRRIHSRVPHHVKNILKIE